MIYFHLEFVQMMIFHLIYLKHLLKMKSFDKKCENEELINEWNDSSNESNDDNEHFKFNLNKQKIISNGHLSPTGSQQSSNGINGQRRFRTQMTPLQIKLMKAIFLEYRTPTMSVYSSSSSINEKSSFCFESLGQNVNY